ncbi:hypothetical protein KNE206_57020 [Kitasatospora sp. NE20-6]|uniref:hypothetical protein n=1 Tax=Kitasatospora sp. NE20-6 TaxID=2859066 RepID=UPI0034DC44FF
MADIELHHTTVEQAAADLVYNGRRMQNSLEECHQILDQSNAYLQGELATAANNFQLVLRNNSVQMNDDIVQAANVLTQMHDILRSADVSAAASFGA